MAETEKLLTSIEKIEASLLNVTGGLVVRTMEEARNSGLAIEIPSLGIVIPPVVESEIVSRESLD